MTQLGGDRALLCPHAKPCSAPCRSGRKGRQRSVVWQGEGSIPEDTDPAPSSSLPSTEDVIRKTEQITKNIQELLRAAQENKHDR